MKVNSTILIAESKDLIRFDSSKITLVLDEFQINVNSLTNYSDSGIIYAGDSGVYGGDSGMGGMDGGGFGGGE